jgi:hypothetical protein
MSMPSSTGAPLLPPTWSPSMASSAARRTAALQPNEQRLGSPATTSSGTRRVSPSRPSPPVAAQPGCRRTGRGGALSSPRTDLRPTSAEVSSTTQPSTTVADQDDWPAAQTAPQTSKPGPPRQGRAGKIGIIRPAKGPTSPSRPSAPRTPRRAAASQSAVSHRSCDPHTPTVSHSSGRRHPPEPLHPALLGQEARRLPSHPAVALCQEPPRPPMVDPENRRRALINNALRHIPQRGAQRAQARV